MPQLFLSNWVAFVLVAGVFKMKKSICKYCLKSLPISQFLFDKRDKGYVTRKCKSCQKEERLQKTLCRLKLCKPISSLSQELWKAVIGWEGLYEVSNFGRIKALKKDVIRKNGCIQKYPERLMSTKPMKHTGYVMVDFSKNGTKLHQLVHRLVAEAFIPNPENKPCINHKDYVRYNNYVKNLEWCTHQENMYHSTQKPDRVFSKPMLGIRGKLHMHSKPVTAYKDGVKIGQFESMRLAGEAFGMDQGSVSSVCRGISKQAKGYVFKYVKTKNEHN